MRLWSLHPMYLDPQGLVANWREALLARHVLNGQTKGYRNHPQLDRFKVHPEAVSLLDAYLWHLCDEATGRGYNFNAGKLGERRADARLPVTQGQLAYEWQHLCAKLAARSPAWYERTSGIVAPLPHPLFFVVPGDVEAWEKVRAPDEQ